VLKPPGGFGFSALRKYTAGDAPGAKERAAPRAASSSYRLSAASSFSRVSAFGFGAGQEAPERSLCDLCLGGERPLVPVSPIRSPR
jgi:hypothetical protein